MFQKDGKFRTRSGRTVTVREDGGLIFDHANGYLSKETAMDAEEFFQAKRDTEIGRWRWPENPHFVVYPRRDGAVLVLNEMSVNGGILYRRGDAIVDMESEAAGAYFSVHPEPKPWHDAKPGEVWVITTSNVADERAVQVTPDRTFQYNDAIQFPEAFLLTYDAIVSGRRIWPEDAS